MLVPGSNLFNFLVIILKQVEGGVSASLSYIADWSLKSFSNGLKKDSSLAILFLFGKLLQW